MSASPAGGAAAVTDRSRMMWHKFKKRFNENPLIYIFLGMTVAALTRGLGAMMSADRVKSQLMMRYRVLFQLCTVGSLVGGIYYNAYRTMSAGEPLEGASGIERAPVVDKNVFSAAAFEPVPAGADAAGSAPAQLR